MPSAKVSGWTRLIGSINCPLGFFVMALLIVEGFLATVLLGGNINPENQMSCIWLGCAMFVIVVVIVFLLSWFKAINLIYDRDAHLKEEGEKREEARAKVEEKEYEDSFTA